MADGSEAEDESRNRAKRTARRFDPTSIGLRTRVQSPLWERHRVRAGLEKHPNASFAGRAFDPDEESMIIIPWQHVDASRLRM